MLTGECAVGLSWTAVTGAERYELWAWTSTDGWQQIGGSRVHGVPTAMPTATDERQAQLSRSRKEENNHAASKKP